MDLPKCTAFNDAPSVNMATENLLNKAYAKAQPTEEEESSDGEEIGDADLDPREVYFLIMHFLSAGPCQRTFLQLWDELVEHELLPRRYHAWYSRNNAHSGEENDDGISFPLSYDNLVGRYSHIEKDHLIKLLKQLVLTVAPPFRSVAGESALSAASGPTLLGTGTFSLLNCDRDKAKKQVKHLPSYLRWPHLRADQVRGLSLREIGGGFSKHHRAPSTRFACYAIAKPSTMVQKMQPIKKLRGHRDAVYCAIFDRSGRYVITGSDDRLVKIWSMETAFCLASCRGHEGDITDLAVSSNNALVASASNDYSIRVWRLPDGCPISVLKGHTGAVTAIAFSPRPSSVYQLLSSSDDGTCRIWDARYSQYSPRVYLPKPTDAVVGKSNGPPSNNMSSSSNTPPGNQILCCAYNASGTIFVTGSSDTFARVWSAGKFNIDTPETPYHEIDILAGHENDVNYVQFSGCSVAPRYSTSDFITEENIPKFKNSWFSHDNIVTCSRDGSAIIWIPRLRRSHGKMGRWTRAYHLKVPPPPMPPQPPRGGPRQRFLPTPRGVNMIVWSLDNRFVLAAIMDNRICVWNANDGSLVHSLTGHTASTYVLDVHPFNPRIAMSAGYDGKTIVWDIWEGTPIRIYEIGRFKLVDGKFSQDGTSIVLSDDVGQIYLLNTGQGESQKDAKYDQFFLGDYRPLIQDTHGNFVDQETQLVPYRRNMQDPLCDSSMIPYPEPYQSTYQRRRLGALGFEWRPSTIKFAIGTDIGMGQEYQILPLADLDIVTDPLPEFVDATFWEPENELINDDTDSEYNVTDECTSEGGQRCLSDSSSSESEYSEEEMTGPNKRESLRRSKRKKHIGEVEVTTSHGRHMKKRLLDEQAGSSSRIKRTKKSRNWRKTSSKRNSAKGKSLRPNRVATRNANNGFHLISEGSTDEEDGDVYQDFSSDSQSSFKDSVIQKKKAGNSVQNEQGRYPKGERELLDEVENVVKPQKPTESHPVQNENRKRLVLKLSIRNPKENVISNSSRTQYDKTDATALAFRTGEGSSREKWIVSDSGNRGSPSSNVEHKEMAENCQNVDIVCNEGPDSHANDNMTSKDGKPRISWGEVKTRTSRQMQSGEAMPAYPCNSNIVSSNYHHGKNMDINHLVRHEEEDGSGNSGTEGSDCVRKDCSPPEYVNRMPSYHYPQRGSDSGISNNQIVSQGDKQDLSLGLCGCNDKVVNIQSLELTEKPKSKKTIFKIKPRKNLGETKDHSKVEVVGTVHDSSANTNCMEQSPVVRILEANYGSVGDEDIQESHVDVHMQHVVLNAKSHGKRIDPEGSSGQISENSSQANIPNEEEVTEFPDAATDATRRARSLTLKATSRQTNVLRCKFKMSQDQIPSTSSQRAERPSEKTLDHLPLTRWTSTSEITTRSRSSRNKGEAYQDGDGISPVGRYFSALRKLNWLLLSEQEEGYRYVPQLNDEVMYIKQGHQEYIKTHQSLSGGPWMKYSQNIREVEICLVEDLNYATLPGSGESCCELTLRFVDPSSIVVGQKFKLTLPDLVDFPDFLVERTRYDAAVERNWTSRDKCLVWWTDETDQGGRWWEGRILAVKDKSSEFPGSPWERYQVRYKNDTTEYRLHSPWELHDPAYPWEHPHIDPDGRNKMLSSINKLQLASRNKDNYGILKLKQAAQKSDFINRFPVPLSPEIIELRLKNNYYRSLEAMEHDIGVMLRNAQSYFVGNRDLSEKMKRLSDWFERKLSNL